LASSRRAFQGSGEIASSTSENRIQNKTADITHLPDMRLLG